MKSLYIRVPPVQPLPTRTQKIKRYLVGSVLSPAYWLLAHRYTMPGLGFQRLCAQLGLRFLAPKAPMSRGWAYEFIFRPMDSTRYVEFDAIWKYLPDTPASNYLDVSSPRQFPLLAMLKQRVRHAELINPDAKDLEVTTRLIKAVGLDRQCHWRSVLMDDAPFQASTFDLITSISVIEHIPDDTAAVRKMWDLLQPGGRLLISMPCLAEAANQYINHNEYGLYQADSEGFVFWQRFYDEAVLADRIFSVLGPPARSVVYGEKIPGTFQRNATAKRASYFTSYPFWREPYMMGQEYRYFNRIRDLPGEGVIAMEFIKA